MRRISAHSVAFFFHQFNIILFYISLLKISYIINRGHFNLFNKQIKLSDLYEKKSYHYTTLKEYSKIKNENYLSILSFLLKNKCS